LQLIEMKLKDPELQQFATPESAALSAVTLCDLCAVMRVVGYNNVPVFTYAFTGAFSKVKGKARHRTGHEGPERE
jgi:hypothetical protein